VQIWAIEGGTGKGVRVSNLARSSCSIRHLMMDDPAYGMPFHIDTSPADLAIIMPGLNDRSQTSEYFKTRLATGIARIRAKGGDVLLVAPGQPDYTDPDIGSSSLVPRITDLYQTADELDVPLLDLAWVRKDWATANALGLYADKIHSNDVGLEHHARAIFRTITEV
jgi:lysophospholipase L1-like esterase